MRREFPKQVQRDAFVRAAGHCEGVVNGKRCNAKLTLGKFQYDHDNPDWMGGEPTLDNCVVLCTPCHKEKTTTRDIPAIARTKRIRDTQMGIRKRKGRPMPGSRDSGVKIKMDGTVVRRCPSSLSQ